MEFTIFVLAISLAAFIVVSLSQVFMKILPKIIVKTGTVGAGECDKFPDDSKFDVSFAFHTFASHD